ncbi:MAG: hypothetical protein R2762_23745 [Bryobacteraceae bacterium]
MTPLLPASLVEILKATAGIMIVMTGWSLVQAFLRRRMAARGDQDMLQDLVHGCGNCTHGSGCFTCADDVNQKEEHNEPHRIRH